MSAASAAARLGRLSPKLESASLRSLFIRVQPPPENLAERRAVLRTLQRYATVEVFKKLAEDTSFVSIVSSEEGAQALIKRAPLKYEFITKRSDTVQPWGSPGISLPIEPIETSKPPEQGFNRMTKHLWHKSFEMHIFPSPDYKHKTTIRYAAVHGPWPEKDLAERETFVFNALKDVVPKGIAADALCDWQSGGQLTDEARVLRAQSDTPREVHIMERQKRRALREQTSEPHIDNSITPGKRSIDTATKSAHAVKGLRNKGRQERGPKDWVSTSS